MFDEARYRLGYMQAVADLEKTAGEGEGAGEEMSEQEIADTYTNGYNEAMANLQDLDAGTDPFGKEAEGEEDVVTEQDIFDAGYVDAVREVCGDEAAEQILMEKDAAEPSLGAIQAKEAFVRWIKRVSAETARAGKYLGGRPESRFSQLGSSRIGKLGLAATGAGAVSLPTLARMRAQRNKKGRR